MNFLDLCALTAYGTLAEHPLDEYLFGGQHSNAVLLAAARAHASWAGAHA